MEDAWQLATTATTAIAPDNPRYVPAPGDYQGKLEPNWYCRGWNSTRKKYCRKRAGSGTDHVGRGRCKFHNGRANLRRTHGLYSVIANDRISDLMAHFEGAANPLDMSGELAMLRALVADFIDRYHEERDAHLAWWSVVQVRKTNDPELRPLVDQLTEGIPRRRMLDISDAQKLVSEVTQTAVRIDGLLNKNAISRADMYRILGEMGRGVELANDETDPDKRLAKIKDYWMSIAV